MSTTIRIVRLLLATVLATATATAADDDPRLAVVGAHADAELADLLTAELSRQDGVVLVERDEISRIVEELELSQLTSGDEWLRAGRLLGAQGLLLLSRDTIAGQPVELARFIATDSGVVLGQVFLPDARAPLEDRLAAVTQRVVTLLPKLRTTAGAGGLRISLLGLRYELDSLHAEETERVVNTLLAHRLSYERDVLLLERWNMKELVWEKSLSFAASDPFATGSFLLAGRISEQGEELAIELRLQAATEPPAVLVVRGRRDALPALVEALVGRIKEVLGKETQPLPWDPIAEGRSYAQLAEWALSNELYEAGVAAGETAAALGYRRRSSDRVRVQGYALLAYPGDFETRSTVFEDEYVERENLPRHIAAAVEAMVLLRDFIARYGEGEPARRYDPDYPGCLGMAAVNNAHRVLRAAWQYGRHRRNPQALRRLRALVRENIEAITGLRGWLPRHDILSTYVEYVPLWYDTPQAALDALRAILRPDFAPYNKMFASELRESLYDHYPSGPWLDPETPDPEGTVTPPPVPWLIAWRPDDEAQLPALWRRFVEDLLTSGSPQDRADGMLLMYRSLRSAEKLSVLQDQMTPFLWIIAPSWRGVTAHSTSWGCAGRWPGACPRTRQPRC